MQPTARMVAFDTLLRTNTGAWADEVLRPLSNTLSPQDAALAHQLTFGCLRRQTHLERLRAALSSLANHRTTPIDTAVRRHQSDQPVGTVSAPGGVQLRPYSV